MSKERKQNERPCGVLAVIFQVGVHALIDPVWAWLFIHYDSTSGCCHAAHIWLFSLQK